MRVVTITPSKLLQIEYLGNDDYPFNFQLKVSDFARQGLSGRGIYSIFDKVNNCLLHIAFFEEDAANSAKDDIQALTLRGSEVFFLSDDDLMGLLSNWDARKNSNFEPAFDGLDLQLALLDNLNIDERVGFDYLDFLEDGSSGAWSHDGFRRFASDNWESLRTWNDVVQITKGLDERFHLQFIQIPSKNNASIDEVSWFLLEELSFNAEETYFLQELNPKCHRNHQFNKSTMEFSLDGNFATGPDALKRIFNDFFERWDTLKELADDEFSYKMKKIIDQWRSLQRSVLA